ncbi:MAG: hypothetical protein CMO55_25575 [Verrucomicrobiales bacterium]|nr:hypothetical protein [Verrucomicrobiales bacterium]
MKELFLIRHAKSDWNDPGIPDHDRPLNSRGERDAPRMAAALKEQGILPDAVVSSTATRAKETAKTVCDGLGFSPDTIELNKDLYLAAPSTILRVIQQFDESAGTAFAFGHNPGMHETVNQLIGGWNVSEFPTLAVARMELNIDYWGEADWECGLLTDLLIPRRL